MRLRTLYFAVKSQGKRNQVMAHAMAHKMIHGAHHQSDRLVISDAASPGGPHSPPAPPGHCGRGIPATQTGESRRDYRHTPEAPPAAAALPADPHARVQQRVAASRRSSGRAGGAARMRRKCGARPGADTAALPLHFRGGPRKFGCAECLRSTPPHSSLGLLVGRARASMPRHRWAVSGRREAGRRTGMAGVCGLPRTRGAIVRVTLVS